jgi:hypothetical protein
MSKLRSAEISSPARGNIHVLLKPTDFKVIMNREFEKIVRVSFLPSS